MGGNEDVWGVSNATSDEVILWLEPWADEFNVPAGSTVTFKPSGDLGLGELEWNDSDLVLWADAPLVEVFIDGVPQDSASALVAVPDGLSKKMLNVLFAGQPSARLAGARSPVTGRMRFWERVRSRLLR